VRKGRKISRRTAKDAPRRKVTLDMAQLATPAKAQSHPFPSGDRTVPPESVDLSHPLAYRRQIWIPLDFAAISVALPAFCAGCWSCGFPSAEHSALCE